MRFDGIRFARLYQTTIRTDDFGLPFPRCSRSEMHRRHESRRSYYVEFRREEGGDLAALSCRTISKLRSIQETRPPSRDYRVRVVAPSVFTVRAEYP